MSVPDIRLEELTLGRVALEDLVDRDGLSRCACSASTVCSSSPAASPRYTATCPERKRESSWSTR